MTKLGCAFISCGASTSSISSGGRGCCAEEVPKVINIKPPPKIAVNQCRVVIFFVFIFLSEAEFLTALTAIQHSLEGSADQGASHSTRVQCYGSGAPGREFLEDIAATPDWPSPSKCPGAEPGTQSSSSAGSANQKTVWFRSVRIPVMLLKAKASLMMASTRTCPLPAALVVKSPIY